MLCGVQNITDTVVRDAAFEFLCDLISAAYIALQSTVYTSATPALIGVGAAGAAALLASHSHLTIIYLHT